MNLRLCTILSLALMLLAVSVYATPGINLKSAAHFGLLAGAGVMNTGSSVIHGHVGSHGSTSAVTGFPPGEVTGGNLYTADDTVTAHAKDDLTDAYNAAKDATGAINLSGLDLGVYNGGVLAPGVYFFSEGAGLTGNLTLDGGADSHPQWIFQIGSTLITGTSATVSLVNARPSDVFWQVGSSATIGGANAFAGNIMALTDISLAGGTLNGRALARNGAVTISAAQIVNVPEPSSIMALGMMLTSAAVLLRRKK